MKIHDVHITNWHSPGSEFWRHAEEKSDLPRIEATISMTLSFDEYRALLDSSRKIEEPKMPQ